MSRPLAFRKSTPVRKFDPAEPRDYHGRWSDGGISDGNFTTVPAKVFIGARDASKRSAFLTPADENDLQSHGLFLSNDAKVGFALSDTGDLQNVFNNGGAKGAGSLAIESAIKHGAKTLDAFDGFLPALYSQHGFVATGRVAFDDAYAPVGWDYAKYGRPDIVFMAYQGDRAKAGTGVRYGHYRAGDGQRYNSYDQAKAASHTLAKYDDSSRGRSFAVDPFDGGRADLFAKYRQLSFGLASVSGFLKFDPNEPRDDHGRWTTNGEGSATALYNNAIASEGGLTADEIVAQAHATELVADARAKLAQLVPTNAPISAGGFMQPDGTYTDERAALQRDIVNRYLNAAVIAAALPGEGEQPTLNILGGRGGSGKSFITSPGGPVDRGKTLLVDADAIKAMLPEYQGFNANQVHEESSHITNMIDDRVIAMGLNVTHDATLKNDAITLSRIARYRAAGYKVNGYYVFATPKVAATRAIGRFARGGTRGRFVPPEVILGNVNNEKNFDKMKKDFSHWQIYDNNGSAPRLVSQGGSK